jgi:hypothetical protein
MDFKLAFDLLASAQALEPLCKELDMIEQALEDARKPLAWVKPFLDAVANLMDASDYGPTVPTTPRLVEALTPLMNEVENAKRLSDLVNRYRQVQGLRASLEVPNGILLDKSGGIGPT